MITISNNDLKQLIAFVQMTGEMREISRSKDLRLNNRARLAKNVVRKLMKRPDIKELFEVRKDIVAEQRKQI